MADDSRSRIELEMPIQGGTVKVLEDLTGAGNQFGVVLKHPKVKHGEVTVWDGNDVAVAHHIANAVRKTLEAFGCGEDPAEMLSGGSWGKR